MLCQSRLGCPGSRLRCEPARPGRLCQLQGCGCAQSCFLGQRVPALSAPRGACPAGARAVPAPRGAAVHSPRVCARPARGGGGGRCAPAAGGGGPGRARGRAGALQGPAAAGSNGEAGAGPANYISGTSIIRGKTRKRWRPAPGGPLPERPGPSLLLLPPPPHGAPAPPRPRRDPDPGPTSGHSAGPPRAERSRLRRGCA